MNETERMGKHAIGLLALIAVLEGGVFALDLATPRGVADGIGYIIPILLAMWLPSKRWIVLVAALCSLLTLVGFWLSPVGAGLPLALTNRLLVLIGLWAVVLLSLRRQAAEEQVVQQVLKEKALLEQRARAHAANALLRTAIEQSAEAVMITNAAGDIQYVNPAFSWMTGYSREEVQGQNPRLLKSDCQPPSFYREMWEVLLAGKAWQGEIVNRRKDGSLYTERMTIAPVQKEGETITHFIAVKEDITERKQAEEALRVSEERLKLVLDATNEGVWDWNIKTGKVYYSPRYAAALGFTPEEIPPHISFWKDLVHPEDRPRLQELLQAHLDGRVPVFEYEYRKRKKDGTWRWSLDHGKVVEWDEEGKPTRMVGSDLDITERKLLEGQLRQGQKMEAIGQLAGGVAHDFNNVIGVILGYSDLLLDNLPETDPRRRRLEEIKNAAERAAGLTRQLLAFSRQQVLQPQVLDLNAVVKNMEKMLHRLLGEDIELVSLLQPELGRVKADPGQIEQVIMNLAINSRDAMPQGGKLTIETTNVELDENYVRNHHGALAGSYVMLAVSDTGEGMNRETQARIFDPFFTTKEESKGTCLGLSTVYGIVKQSGGNIWVYSEPGHGATFKVYLPRVHEEAERAAQVAEEEKTPPGTETILLVEDEDGIRHLAREQLETNGYQVLEAKDGNAALRLEEAHTGPIHLLMTDVVMPGMSGRRLAEELGLRHPEMKVLYISGYTDNAIVHHGVLEAGMHFLQKPFTLGDLARKLRQILGK